MIQSINWKVLVPAFFIALFLCRYYEFFYLYLPVRSLTKEGMTEPTLFSFTMYNFSLKVIFYAFKFLTISVILTGGVFLEGKKNKEEMVSLKDLFLLVLLAEFVFFGQDVAKIINFTFIDTQYTMEDYQNFFPLSLYSALNMDSSSNVAYLLQTLNLFEVGYIGCLIAGLRSLQYPDVTKAASVTLASYGGMLFLWVLVVTYYTLV